MRKTVLALACIVASAFAANAQEEYRNSVSLSAIGSFQQDSSGNGVKQSSESTPGVLVTYNYWLSPHQGLELNYGFRELGQTFTPQTSTAFTGNPNVKTNAHEANASYVLRFPVGHRITPFASAGVGAFVFSPRTNFALGGATASTYATPDFVYSAGLNVALNRRLDLKLGYRGHVFQSPDFGVSALHTGAVSHMAEPFGGLTFHF